MPGFDIEYPLAGATIGPSAHAGGEYDLTSIVKRRLTNELKIKCHVTAGDGGDIGHTPKWTDALSGDQGFWDVALDLVTSDSDGCKLTGELWEVEEGSVNPVTQHGAAQVVQNLSVRQTDAVRVTVQE